MISPPASVGQTAKDAEGHDHRGPLYQYPVTQAEREQLIQEQTQARAVAVKFPTVAAAEAAIGLAILVVFFRNRGTIDVEDVNVMKG